MTKAQRRKREKLEADNEAWIWEMCGPKSGIVEPLTRKFTSQQCEMIGTYAETLKHGGSDLMLASRGEGKTTYLRAMVWKSLAEGTVDFAAFVGATGSDASNSRVTIQSNIYRSEPFAKLYPEIALPCRRVETASQLAKSMLANGKRFDTGEPFEFHPIHFEWSAAGLRFPSVPGYPSSGAMLEFRGADKAIRGLNKYGRRPGVVCIDDLDSPDTVHNPELAAKVVDRVDNDIGGLGTPTKPVARIFLATLPKQGIGVAHHYARQGYPFHVRHFRYLIEKPHAWDMWMEYVKLWQTSVRGGDKYARAAHQFYLDNREKMDAGAVVSNEWRFDSSKLPDGSNRQVSALQNYFDEWADKGEYYCRCELDNEIIEAESAICSNLEIGHVLSSENESSYSRGVVDPNTSMIVRGVDVRKMEIHTAAIATDERHRNRIVNYENLAHGGNEITVEQAENLIYEALHAAADRWESERFVDLNGHDHPCDLTLIDKGWKGSWNEDGETKTWVSQPVERFCVERGLRRYIPAKGSGSTGFRMPAPSQNVVLGDNWYINIGKGQDRKCDELIWNSEHWHRLVEELFLLPEDDPDRFVLFHGVDGYWKNHKRFSDHIKEGCADLAEMRRKGTKKKKPKYRRDHWWDACAMALVAKSVEALIRETVSTSVKQPRRRRITPLAC